MGRGWKRARKLSTAPVPFPTTIFQSPQTKFEGEDFPGHQRQCRQDADLDSVDRHADFEVPADEVQLRLVAFQSGGAAAAATVYFPGFVGLAEQSDGGAAGGAPTRRAVADAADVVGESWTAAKGRKAIGASKSALKGR